MIVNVIYNLQDIEKDFLGICDYGNSCFVKHTHL